MQTIEALLSRTSNPFLKEPAPSNEQMNIVYQCALRAPDHAWLRPWRFIQISGSGRKKLGQAFINATKRKEKINNEMINKLLLALL